MKIIQLDKITSERWVNLFAATYEHNGHTGRWVFASRREAPHAPSAGDAVVMVPILRNPGEPPRLVLIHEFRIPVGGYNIGMPAGLIEPGEPIEEAIRREIAEETGFRVTTIRRITQPLFSSSGLTDESAAMAFIDVEGDSSCRPQLEASEDLEVLLADYESVCRLCNDPSLRIDAKTWLVLHTYQQLGKLE